MTAPAFNDGFVISNEFASGCVRKVKTRNGERLEIRSIGYDQSIRLDAIALESLTWSTSLEVGQNLEAPFGPDSSEMHLPITTTPTRRTNENV